MKKLLVTLCLMTLVPCMASDWVEIGEKSYLNRSTFTRDNSSRVSVWVKFLNNGALGSLGSGIWYATARINAECGYRILHSGKFLLYDTKNAHVGDMRGIPYEEVIPDTLGEQLYETVCRMVPKELSENEY